MSTTPVGFPAVPRDEELRLALVLNGGVSLAIWIGGVACEVNRLVRETHPVYRGLLELTRTRARVDVISGTSAGGINGAALALGSVYDASLFGLRDLWIEHGGLLSLLRDPGATDPPSLLDGDGVFLKEIAAGLGALVRGRHPAPSEDAPMDLTITATLLNGMHSATLDHLGAVIEDANHRVRFRFVRGPQAPGGGSPAPDAFVNLGAVLPRLARAARASASFPVAFEPHFFDPATFPDDPGADVPLSGFSVTLGGSGEPLVQPSYLLDGGILDNKPFESALDAILGMRSNGLVRRVLAYVAPDPGVSARSSADSSEQRPGLTGVAVASLIGIRDAESIADQLATIKAHNEAVRRRREHLTTLLQVSDHAQLRHLAEVLFDTYRQRRRIGLVDYLLEQVADQASGIRRSSDSGGFSRAACQWLRAAWTQTDLEPQLWRGRFPGSPDTLRDPAGMVSWEWGLFGVEMMVLIFVDLLRRTQDLCHLGGDASKDDGSGRAAVPAPPPREEAATVNWEVRDAGSGPRSHDAAMRRRNGRLSHQSHNGSALLGAAWDLAYQIREGTAKARREEHAAIRQAAQGPVADLLEQVLGTPDTRGTDEQRAEGVLGQILSDLPPVSGERCLAWAREMAATILELRPAIEDILNAQPPDSAAERDAVAQLAAYARFLYDDSATADQILQRLLILDVIQHSIGQRDRAPDVMVELVQVSARLASVWGGAEDPAEKLTGVKLGHFAAFYRKGWRANDWMMGRLDGSDRMVRILLNPERLRRLYGAQVGAAAAVMAFLCELAVETAEGRLRETLREHWNADARAIADELSFLDHPEQRVPSSLERAAAALVRRVQLEVLCRELPDVAACIRDDQVQGADPSGRSAELATRVHHALSPATPGAMASPMAAQDAIAILKECRLGQEGMTEQLASDLASRTVGRTIAVAHAAASAAGSGLSWLGLVWNATRLPIAVFGWMTDRLMAESRTAVAIQAGLLTAGLAFVVAALTAGGPSWAAMFGWALLAGGLAAMTLRQPWELVATATAIVLVVAFNSYSTLIALAAVLVGLTALLVLPGRGGGALLLGIALWFSAGQPDWAAIKGALCVEAIARTALCTGHQAPEGVILLRATLVYGLLAILLAWRVGRSRERGMRSGS